MGQPGLQQSPRSADQPGHVLQRRRGQSRERITLPLCGSRNLGFENGRSFDYGVVVTPLENIELSVDYWNIRIDDEVTLLDADMLLRTEAACRLGSLNPSAPECVDASSRIERNPPTAILNPNAITDILINPINASFERTDGMDFGARLHWRIGRFGNIGWTANYTRVMTHYFKQFQGDTQLDLIRSFDNPRREGWLQFSYHLGG